MTKKNLPSIFCNTNFRFQTEFPPTHEWYFLTFDHAVQTFQFVLGLGVAVRTMILSYGYIPSSLGGCLHLVSCFHRLCFFREDRWFLCRGESSFFGLLICQPEVTHLHPPVTPSSLLGHVCEI